MVAFSYRMGAGFAGDVNRTHPASIEPNVNAPAGSNPMVFYGQAGVYNTVGQMRSVIAGDTALTAIAGIAVRQFPVQQSTASAAFGEADLSTGYNSVISPANALDILKSGYIMVPVNGTPVKGGAVYVWIAASTGSHVQGGFEAASTGGSTITLAEGQTYYNSGPDANGICELAFNL
jgi:hypothetical protein